MEQNKKLAPDFGQHILEQWQTDASDVAVDGARGGSKSTTSKVSCK